MLPCNESTPSSDRRNCVAGSYLVNKVKTGECEETEDLVASNSLYSAGSMQDVFLFWPTSEQYGTMTGNGARLRQATRNTPAGSNKPGLFWLANMELSTNELGQTYPVEFITIILDVKKDQIVLKLPFNGVFYPLPRNVVCDKHTMKNSIIHKQ